MGERRTVRLQGEIDEAGLVADLLTEYDDGVSDLTIDLSDAEYLCVRSIVEIGEHRAVCEAQGRRFAVVGLRPILQRLFDFLAVRWEPSVSFRPPN